MLDLFGDIPPFLISLRSIGAVQQTLEKLDQLLHSKTHGLMIKLAVMVDIGEAFVKATYNLEGDGALALEMLRNTQYCQGSCTGLPLTKHNCCHKENC